MPNTKNYREQDGDKWVVDGTLEVNGKLTLQGAEIKQAANQANSTAEDVVGLVADFNALLTKLKTAGLMESN